jgi:hypothetical protein
LLFNIKEVTDSDKESDSDEEVKNKVSTISEEVFLTWQNPKETGGKKAFKKSEIKRLHILFDLENLKREKKQRF